MSRVFVFGSNLLGIHGAGAALFAKRNHGAVQGVGEGLRGNSYALPTKKTPYVYMGLEDVRGHVETFKAHARANPAINYQVTAVGTGRAGFSVAQIGPMFSDAPDNCELCVEFEPYRKANPARR